MKYISYLIQFIALFIICFGYYRLIAFRGIKKKNTKIKNKELPEVRLFILLNKLDVKKLDYMKLAKQLSNLICLNITIVVMLVINVSQNIFARIGICVVSLFITNFISYKLLGLYYKKKGMKKDVQS